MSKKLNGIQKVANLIDAEGAKEDLLFERERLCIDLSSSITDTVTLFLRFIGKFNGIGF